MVVEERRRGAARATAAQYAARASAFSHFTKRGAIAATPATPSAAACRASRSASSNASQPTWTMTRSPWRAPLAAQASASRSRSPTLSDMLSPDVPQTKTPTQPSRRRCAAYLSTFFVDAALGGVELGHDGGPLARERLGVAVCICGVVVQQQRRRRRRKPHGIDLPAARALQSRAAHQRVAARHAVPRPARALRCEERIARRNARALCMLCAACFPPAGDEESAKRADHALLDVYSAPASLDAVRQALRPDAYRERCKKQQSLHQPGLISRRGSPQSRPAVRATTASSTRKSRSDTIAEQHAALPRPRLIDGARGGLPEPPNAAPHPAAQHAARRRHLRQRRADDGGRPRGRVRGARGDGAGERGARGARRGARGGGRRPEPQSYAEAEALALELCAVAAAAGGVVGSPGDEGEARRLYGEAVALFEQALKLPGDDYDVRRVSAQNSPVGGAPVLRDLERVTFPSVLQRQTAHYNIACCRAKLGQSVEALDALETALSLGF